MKVRFPFFAQILSILALQLIVLLSLLPLLFNSQCGGIGWEPLLYSPIGDRLEGISWVIGHQIQGRPQANWNSVLDVFGKFYGVQFSIFDPEGHQLAGQAVTLPSQVAERVKHRPLCAPPGEIADAADIQQLEAQLPRTRRGGRFLLYTRNPKGFWIGTRLRGKNQGSTPLTLIATSTDLWHTKLFLDFSLFLAALVSILALSGLIWVPFVYRVNQSLSELTQATGRIAEGRFETHLSVGKWDEIGRLGEAIDSMSKRLNGFVTGQKRFLGDIAHELCSPIARLQVALEIVKTDGSEKQEQALADIREDVQEMSALINELLAFSKAGLRGKETELVSIELKPLLEEAVSKTCPVNLVDIDANADIFVLGDKVLLQRALANIFRNAVRYAGQCGPISAKAYKAGAEVVISIVDSGPGVPQEALDMLGEPFYRPEPSRSRNSGGVGLGLAIVKTCVDACDGSFKVRNASPKGLEIQIRLKPAKQPASVLA